MPPNPETVEEDDNLHSRRPTSLLNSVHLVRMADNEMTSMMRQSMTPSPSSSRSSPVSLLRVTPYQKEAPDWESPRGVKVTDIVKQFENLNKKGKEYDDRFRNESRSSGIVSDFDEEHDLNWSNSTFSRSSTPRSSQEREELRHDTHYEDVSPLRRPTPRSSVNFTPEEKIWEKDDDDELVTKVSSDPEDEDDEPVAKISDPEDDEVEYGIEINNNAQDENDYTEPFLIVRLVQKLFTFSVFLFLLGSGGYGGLLLRQKLNDDAFNPDQDEVVTNRQSGNYPDPFLPVIVGAITLQFLGWYFIFRNSFKSLASSSSFFVGNGLLAIFQPALYFICGWLSKPENASDSSPSSDPYSANYDPYSASVSESEEKDDIDDDDEEVAFSFDAAIPEESDATENDQKSNTGTVLVIISWLSLIQIAAVITPALYFPELEDMSSLESFLIFGQLPQLVIYLVTWPIFTFLSRKGGNRAKID